MERPRITIHILSALDGKISGPFMALPSAQAAAREYAGLRAAYEADAWLYGATTTKEFTGHRRPVLGCGEHAAPPGDFVAESHADLYYVSVDTLGEIGWESGTFQPPGRPPAHVIEILTEQAPAAYRAYLQERGVSFLLAGQDSLDCQTACQKLYRLFGIQSLLICGGGIVNWSFLQQGVVDEVSLVLAPAADGGASSAAVFQQSPFLQESCPVEFRLNTLERLESDAVQLVYAVRQPR